MKKEVLSTLGASASTSKSPWEIGRARMILNNIGENGFDGFLDKYLAA